MLTLLTLPATVTLREKKQFCSVPLSSQKDGALGEVMKKGSWGRLLMF